MNDRYPYIHYIFFILLEIFNFDTLRVIHLIISMKEYERTLNFNCI